MKKLLFPLLLLWSMFAFFSCNNTDDGEEDGYKLELDESEISFAHDETSKSSKLTITTKSSWQIVIPEEAAWLTVDKTEGEGDAVVEISTIRNNYTLTTLSATIQIVSPANLFTTQSVEVKQNGLSEDFDIFPMIESEALKEFYRNQYDINKDGRLSPAEALAIDNASVDGMTDPNSRSLKGIEYLANLQGVSCNDSPIDELDVSYNTELRYIIIRWTEISELDLSNNPKLEELACMGSPISELDLSGNPLLESLTCSHSTISELDVSHNTALNTLYINDTNISELDLSNNPLLESLECHNNPALTTIYVWEGFDVANPSQSIPNIEYDEGVQFVVKE